MTKEKYVGIFWGAVLIILGVAYLVTGARSFTINDPWLGLAIFAPVAALFFTSYYLSGWQKWGWLFPACIFTGLSIMMLILIATHDQVGSVVAMPLLVSVGAPFFAGYFLNRSRWGLLIPGYIMVVLGILVAFAEQIPGEWFAAGFMLAVALPFLLVYLLNRERKWALIPFVAIAICGIIPLLATQMQDENLGGVISLIIGVPFLVVYFWSSRHWWALIPAGFFITSAVGVILSGGKFTGNYGLSEIEVVGRLVAGVMFLGWALTFFLLWLRRDTAPTRWAIYPAGVLAFFALTAVIGGSEWVNRSWPVILILAGGWMLYNNWRRKQA